MKLLIPEMSTQAIASQGIHNHKQWPKNLLVRMKFDESWALMLPGLRLTGKNLALMTHMVHGIPIQLLDG